MKTLAKKISKVVQAVKHPPQSGYHKFNKFHYSTRDDIFGVIRGELAELGVAIFPKCELVSQTSDGQSRKGNTQTRSLVRVHLTIVDSESGESIDQSWDGEAITGDDKGIQAAATQAMRFWAVNTFMLLDGSDEQNFAQNSTQNLNRQEAPPADPRRGLVDRLSTLGFSEEQTKLFGAYIAKTESVERVQSVPIHRMRVWHDRMMKRSDDEVRESVTKVIEAQASEEAA